MARISEEVAAKDLAARETVRQKRHAPINALVEEHLETGLPALDPECKMSPEEWAAGPENVRRYLLRRWFELKQGKEKWRAEAEKWAKLEPYIKLAQSRGMTLEQLIEYYIDIENRLRINFIDGICYALRCVGHDPAQVIREFLLSVAPAGGYPEHVTRWIDTDPIGAFRYGVNRPLADAGAQHGLLQ